MNTFNKCLLSTYYVPCAMSCSKYGTTKVSKTEKKKKKTTYLLFILQWHSALDIASLR